ncbi:CxxxxCH/CxxCH domain-containing protein [Geomonas sp. RF6]|uniref:CxxxxCH/CxxCH domain c-type cytochrome n=1 Tax=Geomonas sp. RF6 TaxID=2897342 RepID=UPI001E336369|nr:CxxxxCH/CxxCH domain-containing protein [Geomonas sp. RF6]UFS71852.1 CxxxxCH/CxxCH domain-containing protein [Geomonas sp. RF6]
MKKLLYGAAVLLVAGLSGCSRGGSSSSIDVSGRHQAGWVVPVSGGAHPAAYLDDPNACKECHGSDYAGGISKVSCFSADRNGVGCHAGGPSGHPAGWADPDAHGAAANARAAGITGLPHCQACHGADLGGGISRRSCLNTAGCHGAQVAAPHSQKPWRSSIGGRTHSSADASNARACAVCHTGGANSSRKPSDPAPAGTEPGCFNNTLCHGVEGHPTGWSAAARHGAAANAVAGGSTGLSSCTPCHGSDYSGGSAQQGCFNDASCHGSGISAPHPATPWLSTSGGPSHSTTDTSNAGQCALCHAAGANSSRTPQAGDPVGASGCFDNSLCHAQIGHPAGWGAAAQHGAQAKKAPGSASGFAYCQQCHGTSFANGSATSCLNNSACHGSAVLAPHPRKPWFSSTGGASHATADQRNVTVCAQCHTAGANSTIKPPTTVAAAPGCFNNTLCHFHQLPFAPSATIPPSLHGGEAKKDLTVCQACHGTKGTTAFDGTTLADGTRTAACSSCHTFAKAHPTDWQGSGAFSHRTAGSIAKACAVCHDVSQGRTAPLPAAPSCFSTTFTNALGQARTCHSNGPGNAPHAVPYNNHNATARGNFGYCLGCHQVGADVPLTGGKTIPRCLTCHIADPTAVATGCTSCHATPPGGTSYPDVAAVHGSHSAINLPAGESTVCAECHSGLGVGTVDHLNRSRARAATVLANPVVFGALASSGGLTPAYTAAGRSCSNTYCHGNGPEMDKPASAVLAPSWGSPFLTGVAASDCTKCHGYPPANATHAGMTPVNCITCHPHVNAAGTGFTDRTKHVNGAIEATGAHVVPYFTHNAVAAPTCLKSNGGCHNTGVGGSAAANQYPLAKDATTGAPDCMSCHTVANPLLAGNGKGNCRSCHGTGGTGNLAAPTGTLFPNIKRRHPTHHGSVCGTCHPGVSNTGFGTQAGSGAGVNHGPNKNRLSGTTQTNTVQTTTGITVNTPRGSSASCSHGSLIVSGCHDGPGVQSW